jgi:enoyl-CoA hydratase
VSGDLWSATIDDGVVTASFANPPMGYFTGQATNELRSLLRRWRGPDTRVVILTGDGDGRFVTHYDVEEIVELARTPQRAAALGTALAEGFQDVLQEVADLDKPVIAAIDGDAMGGGMELALACDIRVGRDGDGRFGFPEVALGILAGGGGTQRLVRTVGPDRAMEMLLRARLVGSEEALRLGLLHELSADPLARAQYIGRRLVGFPAAALAQTKRAVSLGAEQPLPAGLRTEAEAWLATLTAGTAADAMSRFLAQPLEARRDWLDAQWGGHAV